MHFQTKKILLANLFIFTLGLSTSHAQIVVQKTPQTNINLSQQRYYEVYDPMTGKNKTIIQPIAGVTLSTDNIMAKVGKETVEILTGKPSSLNVNKNPIEPPSIDITLQNQSKTSSTQLNIQPNNIITTTTNNTSNPSTTINLSSLNTNKDNKMLTPNNLTLPTKENEIVVVDPYTGQQKTVQQKDLDAANKSIANGTNTTNAVEAGTVDKNIKKEEPKVTTKDTSAPKGAQDLPKSNVVMSDISSFNNSSLDQYEKQGMLNTNKAYDEFIKNNPSRPPIQIR